MGLLDDSSSRIILPEYRIESKLYINQLITDDEMFYFSERLGRWVSVTELLTEIDTYLRN